MNKAIEFIIIAQFLTLHTFIPFCVFVLYIFAQIVGFPIYCIADHYMSGIMWRVNRRREDNKRKKIFKRISYFLDNKNIEAIRKIYINEDDKNLRVKMIKECQELATQENYNREDYWFARQEMVKYNPLLANQENYDREYELSSYDIKRHWVVREMQYAMLYVNNGLATKENYNKETSKLSRHYMAELNKNILQC